jgi:enoyl-CoA hydratase
MTSPSPGRLILTPGRIAHLVITAPAARNAMSSAMWRALPDLMRTLAAEPGCRALILSGAGGCFSAGADISEFEAIYASPESALAANASVRGALAALRDLPLPVIAAVEGPCIGGGVALALACDHVIAAPGAVFAIPPARLGIAYSAEDTAMLLERLTAPRAKELLMSARRLTADEALSWGLIDRLAADPLQAAKAYAETLAQLSSASIRQAKRTVNALAAAASDAALASDLAALFSGADFIEGRAAFLERRPPRF